MIRRRPTRTTPPSPIPRRPPRPSNLTANGGVEPGGAGLDGQRQQRDRLQDRAQAAPAIRTPASPRWGRPAPTWSPSPTPGCPAAATPTGCGPPTPWATRGSPTAPTPPSPTRSLRPPPRGLTASGGSAQAVLAWTDNANNETGFKIERKLTADPDTSFAQVGTAAANATGFTNSSVPAGDLHLPGAGHQRRRRLGVLQHRRRHGDGASGPAAPTNLNATTANGQLGHADLDRHLQQRDWLPGRAQGRAPALCHAGHQGGERGHPHRRRPAGGRDLHLPGHGHRHAELRRPRTRWWW